MQCPPLYALRMQPKRDPPAHLSQCFPRLRTVCPAECAPEHACPSPEPGWPGNLRSIHSLCHRSPFLNIPRRPGVVIITIMMQMSIDRHHAHCHICTFSLSSPLKNYRDRHSILAIHAQGGRGSQDLARGGVAACHHYRVAKPYLLAPNASFTLAEMASRNARPIRSGRCC